MDKLKSEVIRQFKFYWRMMVKYRDEHEIQALSLCFAKLSEYIDLLRFFYDNLDTLMLWRKASEFYWRAQ